jgi:hypothetical protein
MPNERISMSKLKQLIGLQTSNLSVRALARALGCRLDGLEVPTRGGAAAYRRSAFCEIYRRWEKRLKRSMRQQLYATIMVEYSAAI